MKGILLTISPKEAAAALDGDISVLVRKDLRLDSAIHRLQEKQDKVPIFLYCTQDKKYNLQKVFSVGRQQYFYCVERQKACSLNGKVVAEFEAKSEPIFWQQDTSCPYITDDVELVTFNLSHWDLCKKSIFDEEALINYLDPDCEGNFVGTAVYLNNLQRFKQPKELKEFDVWGWDLDCYSSTNRKTHLSRALVSLRRAPKGWRYIEL